MTQGVYTRTEWHKSRIKGKFVKGQPSPRKGTHPSPLSTQKMIATKKRMFADGKIKPTAYWTGKRNEKQIEAIKKHWKNPDYAKHQSEIRKGQHNSPKTEFKKGRAPSAMEIKKALRRRTMSSLEIKMIGLLARRGLPYKFVGNGDFSIGRKVPDFINCNGEKIAIEVFCRKHKEMFRGGLDRWKTERTAIFNSYGWRLIFFDETEVNEYEVVRRLEGV